MMKIKYMSDRKGSADTMVNDSDSMTLTFNKVK